MPDTEQVHRLPRRNTRGFQSTGGVDSLAEETRNIPAPSRDLLEHLERHFATATAAAMLGAYSGYSKAESVLIDTAHAAGQEEVLTYMRQLLDAPRG